MNDISLASALRGAGRLLDFAGSLSTYRRQPIEDHEEAAYEALRGAWQVLGAALCTIIEQEREDNPLMRGVERDNALATVPPQQKDRPAQTIIGSSAATGMMPPRP